MPAILDKEPCGVRLHPLMQQGPVVLVLVERRSRHLVEPVCEVATHIGRHSTGMSTKAARLVVERDLLANYTTPCND